MKFGQRIVVLFALVATGVLIGVSPCLGQKPGGGGAPASQRPGAAPAPAGDVSGSGTLVVYVKEETGAPVRQMTVVTVTAKTQQYYKQLSAQGGSAEFDGVVAGTYSVQAIAPGYEKAEQDVELTGMNTMASIDMILHPLRDPNTGAVIPGPPVLAPKAQKQLGEALQALRENKPKDALAHLNAALKVAPNHPEVNYLFGVYYAQAGDWANAKESWKKTIEMYPQHPYASLSLGEALFREGNYADALTYLSKAIAIDSSSWRANLLYANAALRQKSYEDAETHARRALEIGHTQAASARFILAEVYFQRGDNSAAATQLRTYLQERPGDPTAQKALDRITNAKATPAAKSEIIEALPTAPISSGIVAAKWMPPNVDEVTPPVEGGVACDLPKILQNTTERVSEFLKNVDKFTATEKLKHESINVWGVAAATENRKFNYLVSYRELKPHFYVVEEYRDGSLDLNKFPEGIATIGLPSLMLVFEKAQRDDYTMTCEGLTRWHGGLAWQVHFAQRSDKPRQLRAYRLGSRSYPIAIKGRAWIAADSYQIVRMETDLLSAPPEVRLTAEHIELEYGPVYFNVQKEPMWVPQNADIYLDWQGHRIHRKHSFSDFLLFGVDEKIRIAPPKETPSETGQGAENSEKPPA
jgi:tetratricopeptide (TPR) repeat protein